MNAPARLLQNLKFKQVSPSQLASTFQSVKHNVVISSITVRSQTRSYTKKNEKSKTYIFKSNPIFLRNTATSNPTRNARPALDAITSQKRSRSNWYEKEEFTSDTPVWRNYLNLPVVFIIIYVVVFAVYNLLPKNSSLYHLMNRHFFLRTDRKTSLETWFLSSFMHADIFHLLINSFVMFQFSSTISMALGNRYFLILYAAACVGSALVYFGVNKMKELQSGRPRRSIACGASGVIASNMALWCLLFPAATIQLYFILPIPAKAMLIGALLIEAGRSYLSANPGGAPGHLGGLLTGLLFYAIVFKRIPFA